MGQTNTLPNTGSEGDGTNNNLYKGPFEKTVSNDNMSNGMGIARPSATKGFESGVPGSAQTETNKLREREVARYNDLAGKVFKTLPITNEGVSLDAFGGNFAQDSGRYGSNLANEQTESGRATN